MNRDASPDSAAVFKDSALDTDICFTAVDSAEQVNRVAALAAVIWREYYVPLIGAAQVEYMVAKFQSAAAMLEQMAAGYEYFMICRGPASNIHDAPSAPHLLGYLAVQADAAARSMFISKLYLQHTLRGGGIGRRALQFIEQLARCRGLTLLWLTVNKRNAAVTAYQKCGFEVAAELCIDIGQGFVMDDYRMERRLT